VSKLHEADIVFESSITCATFLISDDNKLRFMQGLHCLVQYKSDAQDMNQEESYWKAYWERVNWESVDELFKPEKLEDVLWETLNLDRRPTFLNYIPSPEHFRLSPYDWFSIWAIQIPQPPHRFRNYKLLKPGARLSTLKPVDTPGIVTRRKPSYHPYHGINPTKALLLTLSEPSVERRDNDVIKTHVISKRKDGAGARVRAVSIESERTLMNADDDATVVGDNDKLK